MKSSPLFMNCHQQKISSVIGTYAGRKEESAGCSSAVKRNFHLLAAEHANKSCLCITASAM